MYEFCVFAGTTEGRELTEALLDAGASVTACVATEYGQTLLGSHPKLTISARRLTEEEMEALLASRDFACVIDATHPYASAVTENIAAACEGAGRPYLRLLRGSQEGGDGAVSVPDAAAAAAYLSEQEGNVLLTTGSKELSLYTGMKVLRPGPMPGCCPWTPPWRPAGRWGWSPVTSSLCRGLSPGR